MRQLLVVGSLVGALALAAPAGADQRSWYLGLEAGAGTVSGNTSFGDDVAFAAMAVLGTEISDNLKIEGEFGYRTSSPTSYADVDQLSFIASLVYEVSLGKTMSWDLGVGGGIADTTVTSFGFEYGDTQTVLQLQTGLNFDISENTELNVNARYTTGLSGGDFAPGNLNDINNITLSVGVTFGL